MNDNVEKFEKWSFAAGSKKWPIVDGKRVEERVEVKDLKPSEIVCTSLKEAVVSFISCSNCSAETPVGYLEENGSTCLIFSEFIEENGEKWEIEHIGMMTKIDVEVKTTVTVVGIQEIQKAVEAI